jgi:hypothetical protein
MFFVKLHREAARFLGRASQSVRLRGSFRSSKGEQEPAPGDDPACEPRPAKMGAGL